MHLFRLLLMPQIAVSCGFIYPSSLADKHFCPKWKTGKTEVQRNAFLKAFKGDL